MSKSKYLQAEIHFMKKLFLFLSIIIYLQGNSQHVLKISPGTFLKTSEASFIVSENTSLINDGNLQQASGVFKFTGDRDAFVSGKNSPTFARLIISKTGTAKLKLQQHIAITGELNFASGLLDLNNFNIDLGTTGLLTGENESSHTIGNNGGYIQIIKRLNAPSSANPGNLGAIFTSAEKLGSVTVRRGHQSQAKAGESGASTLRYYDIRAAGKKELTTTLQFSYLDAELNNLFENNLALLRSQDNIIWSNADYTLKDQKANFVEKINTNPFSRWTLSHIAGVNNDWKVWPNPVTENVWLSINSSLESKATIKIIDSKGTLISIQESNLRSGNNLLTIDMKKLAAGTYLIFADWANGQMQRAMKVVKM